MAAGSDRARNAPAAPGSRRPVFSPPAPWIRSLPLVVLLGMLAPPAGADDAMDLQVSQALAFAEEQLVASIAEIADPSRYPRSTDSSTGRWKTVSASDWTSGFFPGLLWKMAAHTGSAELLDAASLWTAGLASQATRTDTHDLGFMIGIPFGQGYRQTGDPSYLATYLVAAGSLSSRFDPDVGAIRSWDFGSWEFPVIIDNMMNLELLLQGARWTDQPAEAAEWEARAAAHAAVTAREHVRADASTYHWVDFDPSTGAVLAKGTLQGAGPESTWARGQAWGLYGFALTYRFTWNPARLADAMALADYFIDHLPDDSIPYWDFEAPGIPEEPRDSSAAAIAAAGLLELSTLARAPADRERYERAAEAILRSLLSPTYLATAATSSGILLHGMRAQPTASEADVTLIYGDYYFVQALLRYQELSADAVPLSTGGGLGLLATSLLLGGWGLLRRKEKRRGPCSPSALSPGSGSAPGREGRRAREPRPS